MGENLFLVCVAVGSFEGHVRSAVSCKGLSFMYVFIYLKQSLVSWKFPAFPNSRSAAVHPSTGAKSESSSSPQQGPGQAAALSSQAHLLPALPTAMGLLPLSEECCLAEASEASDVLFV